jgi:hypothetical protein
MTTAENALPSNQASRGAKLPAAVQSFLPTVPKATTIADNAYVHKQISPGVRV